MTHGEQAVRVDRSDGTSVRIGPIRWPHVARSMHRYFTVDSISSRDGAAECTVTIVSYDESVEHLPLVPANRDDILVRLDDPIEGADAPFPDLWDRLCGQHGYDVAREPWDDALRYSD